MLGPPHRGARPNGSPHFAPEDPPYDAAALVRAGLSLGPGLGIHGIHGYGPGAGLSGGVDTLPQAPMPSAPMPSGPPSLWHSPPPPPRHAPPTVPATPPGIAVGGHGAGGSRTPAETLASAQEMLAVVSHRVAPMLAAAARHSETQVSAELRKLDTAFQSLRDKAVRVETLLRARDHSAQQLPKDGVGKMLLELENRWDQEIKALKRELHQTILAHNHNADLMADHKSAIDKIRSEIDERGAPPRFNEDPQLQDTLTRLGSTLERNVARDQDVDTILQRGELLLQRYAESMAGAQSLPPVGSGVPMPASPYAPGQAFHQGYSHHMVL